MIRTNESTLDRIIRGIAGIILLALALTSVVTGALSTVLIVLGAVLLLTGLVGFCPLYALLKISTYHA